MPSITDFPARGKLVEINGQAVVFHPTGTTYRMNLGVAAGFGAELDKPIEALVRVRGRKVLTVPSGGLFVAPIFGPPRTVQGRVRYLDERQMVLNAGVNVVVELPGADAALDLTNGPIAVGRMVNVSALPGATLELLNDAVVGAVSGGGQP